MSASMSRGKAIQTLRVTRQAARASRSPFAHTMLSHYQSSSGVNATPNNAKVKFSAGADETSLTAALHELLDSAGKGGRWKLIPTGQGLERSFRFKNFAKTSGLGLYYNPVPHDHLSFNFAHVVKAGKGSGIDNTSLVSLSLMPGLDESSSQQRQYDDEAILKPSLLPTCLQLTGRHNTPAKRSMGGGYKASSADSYLYLQDFMTAISLQCKLKNHHPEWSNVYNTTYIRWTTHNPEGLSAKDVELAGLCDSLARDFGEVVVDDGNAAQSHDLRQVADRVKSDAGDCCTPKKP
ncbi:hypothetical protein E0Z10_g6304 [Xylaria hypoxylon]|uniref:4a-hydroxytetrahydrobiopterin dehydratase n=1 Tax=Xylaria hypoxylon TaxID=37992 RepID=A0A4Z0YTN8_9PEZI|nr:hypothetical protein E0Z10_g6304 [Xylaria hypoxylon]